MQTLYKPAPGCHGRVSAAKARQSGFSATMCVEQLFLTLQIKAPILKCNDLRPNPRKA
jgi:hypothetical protein